MATKPVKQQKANKDPIFRWEAKDRTGKLSSGEMRAPTEIVVSSNLRKQGLTPGKIKKLRVSAGKKITDKEIALFTRQLSTMMKAGVPLLKSFEIVSQGHSNPAVSKLLNDIKSEVENGSSLAQGFAKFPKFFDSLYVNLIGAGEQAGILEDVLERLATYREKTVALKRKIKSALFYPISIIAVAVIITAIIMIFVIPSFKSVFAGFGAELPLPTMILMSISDFVVAHWFILFGGTGGIIYGAFWSVSNITSVSRAVDKYSLKLPVFGDLLMKATVAKWTRTLSTMFAAGVPLVESLNSVAGASGNYVYEAATRKIQLEVATGTSLTTAMVQQNIFPNMVTQMTSIGEESGSLDAMLSKVADFYEEEVDDAVGAISSLMEPMIMVVLGTLIGGMVIALYLPIFKMGAIAS
jgi:type IV pilus assembly protein PilC